MTYAQAQAIVEFWFSPRVKPLWFRSTDAFDAEIRERWEVLWREEKAELGAISVPSLQQALTNKSAESLLAAVILLDQFPLNMFRGRAEAYATEQLAVCHSRAAITAQKDTGLNDAQRAFLYMPLMHSENMVDQDLAVEMYEKAGLQSNLRFARHHRGLVERFGRFPHRNRALGRQSTEAELAYLASKEAFRG